MRLLLLASLVLHVVLTNADASAELCEPTEITKFLNLHLNGDDFSCVATSGVTLLDAASEMTSVLDAFIQESEQQQQQLTAVCVTPRCRMFLSAVSAANPRDCELAVGVLRLNLKRLVNRFQPFCDSYEGALGRELVDLRDKDRSPPSQDSVAPPPAPLPTLSTDNNPSVLRRRRFPIVPPRPLTPAPDPTTETPPTPEPTTKPPRPPFIPPRPNSPAPDPTTETAPTSKPTSRPLPPSIIPPGPIYPVPVATTATPPTSRPTPRPPLPSYNPPEPVSTTQIPPTRTRPLPPPTNHVASSSPTTRTPPVPQPSQSLTRPTPTSKTTDAPGIIQLEDYSSHPPPHSTLPQSQQLQLPARTNHGRQIHLKRRQRPRLQLQHLASHAIKRYRDCKIESSINSRMLEYRVNTFFKNSKPSAN